MGADTKQLRVRIKSVDSTLHLTKAMGLVASSKMRRAMQNMLNQREYSSAVINAVESLTLSPECRKSPYMEKRDGGKTLIITVAGDRGLAGGYNSNVFKLSNEYADADFISVGKRANERYGQDGLTAEGFKYEDAVHLAEKVCELFRDKKYDKIGIISTRYVSMISQKAELRWILPLEKSQKSRSGSILFEPDELTVLNAAITEYVAAILYHGVKESFASENAARRMAMDSAGKNAQQMIDSLMLEYNRARQGAITQEITEIVAGSGNN